MDENQKTIARMIFQALLDLNHGKGLGETERDDVKDLLNTVGGTPTGFDAAGSQEWRAHIEDALQRT